MRALFKDLELDTGETDMTGITDGDTGELDAEDVFCSACGHAEATDENDILLCDGFCERAYHQRCVVPPVATEDIPPGDEGWLCPLCDARVDAFYTLNSDFDTTLAPESATWTEVFAEEAALDAAKMGPGQPNEAGENAAHGKAAEEEWPDDEEDDKDFAAEDQSDAGEDDEDEPLSGSAYSGSDSDADDTADSAAKRLRAAMEAEPEVVQGKRRRAVVDYRKLNDEMFGDGEAFEGEAEDEAKGGWGPTSPVKGGRVSIPRSPKTSGAKKRKRPSPNTPRSSTKKAQARAATPGSTPRAGGSASRRRLSEETRAKLERKFATTTHPTAEQATAIGQPHGLSGHQVKVWFSNRRAKEKRIAVASK